MPTPQLNTIGRIATALGVPLHRVEYVIRSRNIQPTARAGSLRVFSKDDVILISMAIVKMDKQHHTGRVVSETSIG